MSKYSLNDKLIKEASEEAVSKAAEIMGDDLVKAVLYGSCARGDYSEESDIDIALLTRCDRLEVKKYRNDLSDVTADIATRTYAMISFICLPYDEFNDRKSWYPFFENIDKEGVTLHE